MDTLIGLKLVKVERLGWHQVGEPDDLSVGPVHLIFEGCRGIFLAGRDIAMTRVLESVVATPGSAVVSVTLVTGRLPMAATHPITCTPLGVRVANDSPMDSTQKVVVVTGASGGIGAAVVAGYRGLGYAVTATGLAIQPSADPEVLAVSGDVAEFGAGARIVDATMDRFGRVDTLVNCAGLFVSKPFTEYTDADYEKVVGVNLRGFFDIARSAIKAMLSRDGGGHVVSISTSLVDNADARVAAGLTSLTKGGLNAVTKSLAIEYATRGIRVNTVALGVIHSPMHPDDPGGFQAALHPVNRMGEIEDVVRAILYLEQSPFVTGEISHVDGGQSAGH